MKAARRFKIAENRYLWAVLRNFSELDLGMRGGFLSILYRVLMIFDHPLGIAYWM
ncbi:hypothetical protein AM1_1465 [Acaryochloris marina MBIC11017]|uniref:Uncharacterized protein n=1 Tax=Acaryochloris marina (strain MBIC 11017) TaxID=329726 RepID=B0C7V2_ACAM1|nr:hypothetical protein AM1_1465 [Acaryochloris marina MBIC11017]